MVSILTSPGDGAWSTMMGMIGVSWGGIGVCIRILPDSVGVEGRVGGGESTAVALYALLDIIMLLVGVDSSCSFDRPSNSSKPLARLDLPVKLWLWCQPKCVTLERKCELTDRLIVYMESEEVFFTCGLRVRGGEGARPICSVPTLLISLRHLSGKLVQLTLSNHP